MHSWGGQTPAIGEAWRTEGADQRLALPQLPAGFYVLVVADGSGQPVFIEKMLKN